MSLMLPPRSARPIRRRRFGLGLVGLLFLLAVAGCTPASGTENSAPTVSALPVTVAPTATPATLLPTPTPSPTPSPTTDVTSLSALLAESVPLTASTFIDDDAYLPILVPTPIPETIVGTVAAALINVRNGPRPDARVLRTEEEGSELQILGSSDDGTWLQICCPGEDAYQWVAAEFVDVVDGPPAPTAADSGGAQGDREAAAADDGSARVTADLVNLRAGPGVVYAVVGQKKSGDALEIVGKSEAGDWWQLCCTSAGDQQPWVKADLVSVDGDLAADIPNVAAPPVPDPPPNAVGGGVQVAAGRAASAPGLPGDGSFGGPGGTNPLTGRPLPGDRQGLRPLIVCINNDFAARPQYGISQADVMYEYIMEGFGITRFSGIYLGETVSQVGPVRSARLINYYLGALYNAGLVCSGASDQVRYLLKHQAPFPYMDIDLDDPSNLRYSVSIGKDYRTRLRTSIDKLHRWLADWGVQEPARLRGLTFGDVGGGAPASTIAVPYPSGTGSQVRYVYDGGSGRYLRSMGGAPHLDGNSGAQVGVENVIIQVVPHEATDIVEDSLGSTSIRLNLFGSGRAILFRDGQAHPGIWRSESRGDLPRFYREDGTEIALKPGRSWISVVPPDYTVSYQ